MVKANLEKYSIQKHKNGLFVPLIITDPLKSINGYSLIKHPFAQPHKDQNHSLRFIHTALNNLDLKISSVVDHPELLCWVYACQ